VIWQGKLKPDDFSGDKRNGHAQSHSPFADVDGVAPNFK
jgi:hypothetical protein